MRAIQSWYNEASVGQKVFLYLGTPVLGFLIGAAISEPHSIVPTLCAVFPLAFLFYFHLGRRK